MESAYYLEQAEQPQQALQAKKGLRQMLKQRKAAKQGNNGNKHNGSNGNGIKKKSKKKWIVIAAVVALLVFILWPRGAGNNVIAAADVTELAYGDLVNSISATGRVESAESHRVYSTLNYTVADVYVEVGDVVTADTVLCSLDSTTLEETIHSKELSTGISAKSAAQQVQTARDNYNAAKSALENGNNSSLISAESSVTNAYDNWQKAQRTYNDYKDGLSNDTNSGLISQDSSVQTAQNSYNAADDAYTAASDAHKQAKRELEAYVAQYEADALAAYNAAMAAGEPTAQAAYDKALAEMTSTTTYQTLAAAVDAKKQALNSASTALNNADYAYETAKRQRDSAYISADQTLAEYAINVDTAYAAYQTAQKSYDAALVSAQNSLQSSKNSLDSALISSNNDLALYELANLQQDLEDCQVKAGIAGTVTAVYATVGSSGSGLLFMVEDVARLIVETTVKEYDIGTVELGMPVTIKSDAINGTVYDGTMQQIAPTVTKTAQGVTDTASDGEFAAEVRVTSQNTKLRIGMSVRLNYIIEQQSQVLAVPYSAIYYDSNGQATIMVLDELGEGSYRPRELAVTAGMENDLSIAISGSGVDAGLLVVSEPDSYLRLIGQPITLVDQSTALPSGMTMGIGF